MNKSDKRYAGYKVSPGAQLYIEDLEETEVELRRRIKEYNRSRDGWRDEAVNSLAQCEKLEKRIKELETALLKVQDDMQINVRLIKQVLKK